METEFVMADICECERSTQFETTSVCKTIPSEASMPHSLAVDLLSERAPTPPTKIASVVPSIISDSDVDPPASPAAVPLPLSEFSPMLSSGSREVEPEPPAVTEVTHTEIVSTGDLSFTLLSTVSPTSPGELLRTGTVGLMVLSRLVVSCNKPVFKSMGHYSSTPEYQTRCSTCSACLAVCFWFNQGTIDLCFLSVSLPTRLP